MLKRRKVRRKVGYSILQKIGIDTKLGRDLLARFQETEDEGLLEIIARSPRTAVELDYIYVLEHLSDRYWRMRILEALLSSKYDVAAPLAPQYPFEFTYASGRLGYRQNLPIIRRLFAENKEDPEFVSIYTWALGKLGAQRDLQEVRRFIQKYFKKSAS